MVGRRLPTQRPVRALPLTGKAWRHAELVERERGAKRVKDLETRRGCERFEVRRERGVAPGGGLFVGHKAQVGTAVREKAACPRLAATVIAPMATMSRTFDPASGVKAMAAPAAATAARGRGTHRSR